MKNIIILTGPTAVGKTEIYKMPIGEWECIEMELAIS